MAKILRKIQKHLKRNIDNREITLEEMQKLIKNGAIVIDVRSMQEYNEGHVDGAISIPEYEIDEKTNHDDIPDLGYYFNPWAGIDNDCNYIDDKCKQET